MALQLYNTSLKYIPALLLINKSLFSEALFTANPRTLCKHDLCRNVLPVSTSSEHLKLKLASIYVPIHIVLHTNINFVCFHKTICVFRLRSGRLALPFVCIMFLSIYTETELRCKFMTLFGVLDQIERHRYSRRVSFSLCNDLGASICRSPHVYTRAVHPASGIVSYTLYSVHVFTPNRLLNKHHFYIYVIYSLFCACTRIL